MMGSHRGKARATGLAFPAHRRAVGAMSAIPILRRSRWRYRENGAV
jgi:hypothetical protein